MQSLALTPPYSNSCSTNFMVQVVTVQSLLSSWSFEPWVRCLHIGWAWCLDAIWALCLRTLLACGALFAITNVAMAGASCKFYVSTKRTFVRYHHARSSHI